MLAKRWTPRNFKEVSNQASESFTGRYATAEGIDIGEARHRFDGLKQFLYVCAVSPGSQVAPATVGPMWQEFVATTKGYRQFCHSNFGRFIEHSIVEAPSSTGYLDTRRAAENVLGPLDETLWPRDGNSASRHTSDLD
jgi:hypothetical protein